ncbi:MAG TPA: alpha/beta fold hydrolase [Conexibacter sp.]|jgi:polyhydroxyalkanoate synthase
MDLIPTPEQLSAAAANVFDRVVRGGLADLTPLPSAIIDESPQRTVRRYLRPDDKRGGAAGGLRPPVLLVPPLAAPASCFDLRRGCSVAEHLLAAGHRTYLVDYGAIAFSDRNLGIEHWVDEVLPRAIEAVLVDAAAEQVQLVGWCLGGIMALLVAADRPAPIRSVTLVASPFDTSAVPLVAPLRPLVNLAGGSVGALAYKALGGAPAPLVRRMYQLAGFDKYVMKPFALATNLDDREFLAQVEAVDSFTHAMLAYPGRTFGQLYHRVLRHNDLAAGHMVLGERTVELAGVRAPVLSIAGEGDGIAPQKAVHKVAELLPNAPEVRLESAPGGHLGVLTGRAARRTTWPLIDAFLLDTADPNRAPSSRRHLRAVA